MRLVTWNCCRGTAPSKLERLQRLAPDVVAVPECAAPDPTTPNSSWVGDKRNHGLLLYTSGETALLPIKRKPIRAKYFLPAKVLGTQRFNVLAVWAKKAPQRPAYVNTLFTGIRAYRELIDSGPTVILGDLNTASYFGEPHHEFVEFLRREFGLVSAYHEFFGVEHGEERHSTLFHQYNTERRFHIDYCFIPVQWVRRLERVHIPPYSSWRPFSDHCPLVVDIR